MRTILVVSLGFLLIIAIPFAVAQDKESKQEEAARLFEMARAVSGFRYEGAPPFRMRAQIQLGKSKKTKAQGEYELLWKSPQEWRETFTFPDHVETRYAAEGGYQVLRKAPHTPAAIWQAAILLSYGSTLERWESGKIRKIGSSRRSGGEARCVSINYQKTVRGESCFDMTTGVLVSEKSTLGRTEYSDFQEVDGHWFPQTLRLDDRRQGLVEAGVEEFLFEENLELSDFAAPPESVWVPWCPNPMLSRKSQRTHYVAPKYPEIAKIQRREGTVVLEVHIGADGRPKDLKVRRSAGPAFDAAATSAVEQWRYSPARCGDQSVETYTFVEISFSSSAPRRRP